MVGEQCTTTKMQRCWRKRGRVDLGREMAMSWTRLTPTFRYEQTPSSLSSLKQNAALLCHRVECLLLVVFKYLLEHFLKYISDSKGRTAQGNR